MAVITGSQALVGSCVMVLCTGVYAAGGEQETIGGVTYEHNNIGWAALYQGHRFEVIPGSISLKLAQGTNSIAELNSAAGDEQAMMASGPLPMGTQEIRVNALGVRDLQLPAGTDSIEVCLELIKSGRVVFAEPNVRGVWAEEEEPPNDPLFGNQYALHNTGQTGGTSGADMKALNAWSIQRGNPEVVIAVVDSGIDLDHPALQSTLWKNPGEIAGNGFDDDGNGFVDDVVGWDFEDNDQFPNDTAGHGTMVAGCIGARANDGIGIASLAGGNGENSGCRMMGLLVGSSFPMGSIVDDAIIYAADNGASVITMSLSISPSVAVQMAIEYANSTHDVFIDCASGNNGPVVAFPANDERVMAVAATNDDDELASFSNSGPEVEVAAPGVSVLTSRVGGSYQETNGTSFSAPHVSAVAGLIRSENECLSAEEVRDIIRDSAEDVHIQGFDEGTGHGRVDAYEALLLAGSCGCPGDFDDNGVVNGMDFGLMLVDWGTSSTTADLDGNGNVDGIDVGLLLSYWGTCGS